MPEATSGGKNGRACRGGGGGERGRDAKMAFLRLLWVPGEERMREGVD